MNAVTYIKIATGNFNVIHRPKLLQLVSVDDGYKLLYNILDAPSPLKKAYLMLFISSDYIKKSGSKVLDEEPKLMANYLCLYTLINQSKILN